MLKLSVILLLIVVACATADLFQDDKGVLKIANFASKDISNTESSPFHYRLFKITQTEKERVEGGYLHRIALTLGMTNCKKQDMSYEEASKCDIQDKKSAYLECSVAVREEDGNGELRMLSAVCMLNKDD